jgi:hypothetical protein
MCGLPVRRYVGLLGVLALALAPWATDVIARPGPQQNPAVVTASGPAIDPQLAQSSPNDLIGDPVLSADQRHLGHIADVVRNRNTGEPRLVVAHTQIENLTERYAALPLHAFRMWRDHLQLVQPVSRAEFQRLARQYLDERAIYYPVTPDQVSAPM